MGGCRCTFRDCKNSTTNMPGTHFFHFPYKDADRCKKWALYSRRIEFLSLPHSQLRNKTICGIHFAEKCFMNYLKESLNRNAVPTLLKDEKGEMCEVDVDETELATLVYPVQSKPYTIDLPEKCTTKSIDDNESVSSVSFGDSDAVECERPNSFNRILKRNAGIDEQAAPIELAINKYGSAKRFASVEVKTIPRKRIFVRQYKSEKESPSVVPRDSHQLVAIENSMDAETSKHGITKNRSLPQNHQRASTSQDNQMADNFSNADDGDIAMNDFDSNASFNRTESAVKHEDKSTATTIEKDFYLQTMAEHTKQIDELKKMLAEKVQSERGTSQQSTSVSASSSSDVRGEMKIAKSPAMTKIQLFNAIRRYLNPSMVALLRMEIFGGAEREYRTDEKQIAKELFNLNAFVYDYMREEWRFRLPSKAQVELWLKEPDDEDVSDFF